MRVLHVINDLRVGGAEVLVKDLAPRLRAAGVETEALALGAMPGSFLEGALRDAGVPTHVPADASLYHPRQWGRLAARMRGFDVVHVHLFPAQMWAALAAQTIPRRFRPVLVTTEHNTTNNRRGKPYLRPVEASMYGRYARVAAVGEAVAEALTEWAPVTRGRTEVIPTAVDVGRFANAAPADKREVLGVAPDVPVALCVGRLEPQKDQATLLRALPKLPDVHAVLVGDGHQRAELEALARELGVADRAHFLGRRPDVPNLLKMADVYVQPSRWEGWSIAILEVMASASAPIVASRAPGLAQAVEGRGLLFDVGDADGLARAVTEILLDAPRRAELAARCREAANRHRIEKCVAQHVAFYEAALGDATGQRRAAATSRQS